MASSCAAALPSAPQEAAPAGRSGQPARSLLLVGQAGSASWPHFLAWRQGSQPTCKIHSIHGRARRSAPSPTIRCTCGLALRSALSAVPAMGDAGRRAATVAARHPHASAIRALARLSRGAAVRPGDRDGAPARSRTSAIAAWRTLPEGLSSRCPREVGFHHAECLAHVRGPLGGPCRGSGCLDRNACPYGTEYRYSDDEQTFHMKAFAR